MSRILITPKDWPEIEYPRCSDCGLEMWLIRIAPQSGNREVRTFECAVCDSIAGEKAMVSGSDVPENGGRAEPQ